MGGSEDMHGSENTNKKIVHRLKIARGHLDKVIQMAENNDYCMDVIHQSQAVQSALREADNQLLDSHLKTCVVEQIKNGKAELSIEEIMKVFKKNK